MTEGFTPTRQPPSQRNKPSCLKPAVTIESVSETFLSHFSVLEYPRGKRGQEHAFVSIVLIAILATIGGAKGWEDIETYGISHEQWLESFLNIRNGVPRK